uniref:Uncharacterized protein n=1 Tax=viral metagenome TaxID=1070528 RepID=A0A6C0LHV4_9ZZZZ
MSKISKEDVDAIMIRIESVISSEDEYNKIRDLLTNTEITTKLGDIIDSIIAISKKRDREDDDLPPSKVNKK